LKNAAPPIRVSSSLRNLAFLSVAAAGLAFAQAGALTGTYAFSERGSQTTTLANLTFGADGTASGTAVVQQGFQVSTYAVQGTYVTNADNSKTLTLSGPSLDSVDVNGNPLVFNEVVMLVPVFQYFLRDVAYRPGPECGRIDGGCWATASRCFRPAAARPAC
jgi:hypothetical protein